MQIRNLQVLVMDNDEILCEGKKVGSERKLRKYLTPDLIELRSVVKDILKYESDTFSSSSMKLTQEEAYGVAGKILRTMYDNKVDGLMIGDMLQEVRGIEN